MTKNFKLKKLLVLVIALLAISVSVLIVNAAQAEEQAGETKNQTEVTETNTDNNISTYFHEASGTLIVSGKGELKSLYPRGYEVYDDGIGEPLVVPDAIEKIDTSVKHLILEEGITSLYNSFNDLHNLETISFPDSLKSIDASFRDCDKIKTLTFPSKTEKIDLSFDYCDGVTDINFSGGAVDIVNCFSYMAGLKEVHIPAESRLGSQSFYGCDNLKKIVLGSGVELYQTSFFLLTGDWKRNEDLVIFADKKDESRYRECFSRDGTDHYEHLNFAYYSTTPEKLNATSQANGIKLDWEAKLTADTYHIYRKANGESQWTKIGDTKASSYFDTSVENNKTYTYMLKVDNSADGVTAKVSYLSAPKLTKITNEAYGVRIYWSKVTGADGYYLYRRVTGTKDWSRIATVKNGSTVSYKDTKAAAGKTYDYIIRAYSGNVTSAPAEKVIRIKRLTVPSLTSVSNSNDGVTIKWKKVAGADSYIVYRKVYDAKTKQWSSWNRHNVVTKTSCVDKITESGVRCKYTVKACYGSYTSYYNTSGIEVIRLETPEISSATSTKSGVKLEWNKITGASGYKIYRKTADSGWGEAIATVKGNSVVTYVDKTAKKGVTYTYTVRAYSGNTKSGYIAAGKTVKDKY